MFYVFQFLKSTIVNELNLESKENRLKHAPYHVDLSTLERVRSKLEAEGFQRRDLIYEDSPTTGSLWTKTSVLIEHLLKWQGEDKYKTAFAVLKEHHA